MSEENVKNNYEFFSSYYDFSLFSDLNKQILADKTKDELEESIENRKESRIVDE
jgi:hypothetical protein